MSFSKHYQPGKVGLSFELFPPQTATGFDFLQQHITHLVGFGPDYMTCTYGAGGSTREKTLDVIGAVQSEHHIPVASHLTCVGSTVAQLREYLDRAVAQKVDYIVALRGDPPQGQTRFVRVPGGLEYAHQLVTLIHREYPQFGIAVGGYPEVHQEQSDAHVDLDYLKQKVDCGADIVITQLFYNNTDFLDFRERYQAIGSTVPLVPGILPITNLKQVQRITSLCGAKLPQDLCKDLQRFEGDPDSQVRVGVDFAVRQTNALLAAEVPGLHFYVLNKSQATSEVLLRLEWPRIR